MVNEGRATNLFPSYLPRLLKVGKPSKLEVPIDFLPSTPRALVLLLQLRHLFRERDLQGAAALRAQLVDGRQVEGQSVEGMRGGDEGLEDGAGLCVVSVDTYTFLLQLGDEGSGMDVKGKKRG